MAQETRLESKEIAKVKFADAVNRNQINCGAGANGIKTVDTVEYITGEITAGGKIDLFKPISEGIPRIGINSFDGRKYNTLGNAVIDAVAVEVATTTSTTETAAELVFDAAMDVAILNSHIKFAADGKLLFELPMYEVHNPNTTDLNDKKYRSIGHLPIIEAEKNLTCDIEFPNGVNPDVTGGKRHFIKVSLRVIKTVSK